VPVKQEELCGIAEIVQNGCQHQDRLKVEQKLGDWNEKDGRSETANGSDNFRQEGEQQECDQVEHPGGEVGERSSDDRPIAGNFVNLRKVGNMFTPEVQIAMAFLLLRGVAGALFFFQGYDKLFNIGVPGVATAFTDANRKDILPTNLFRFFITISSWVEFICGALLFFGLFRGFALTCLSLNLLFVAIAFSNFKAMWDMQYFFPRMVFVTALLLMPWAADRWSLDLLLEAYLP
jgi:uncharacterized membrane protein YphA (DoxX/SURF4 family)